MTRPIDEGARRSSVGAAIDALRGLAWQPVLSLSVVLVAFAGTSAAEVVVVDPAGGAPAAVQSAIDAAIDGDVLLLGPGDWDTLSTADLVIGGKGLTLAPLDATRPAPLRHVVVSDVPVGSAVVLRHLEIVDTLGATLERAALEIRDCAGHVWIEACVVVGGDGTQFIPLPGTPAVRVTQCASVDLTRCELRGGRGGDASAFADSWYGATAIHLVQSTVAVHDGTTLGGDGGDGTPNPKGAAGGDGILGQESVLAVVGGRCLGGNAGNNEGEPGGHAISIVDASSLLRLRDVALGAGRSSPGGPAALEINAVPFVIETWDAPVRTLRAPSPVREGQPFTLTYEGRQRDVLSLAITLEPFLVLDDPAQGMAIASGAPMIPLAVVIDPSGVLTLSSTLPHLPVGFDDIVAGLQVIASSNDGPPTLSSTTSLIWVPAGTS